MKTLVKSKLLLLILVINILTPLVLTNTAGASSITTPFYRETVAKGAKDIDAYHIAHVRELQYRLKWVGVFDVAPTGNFGNITKASVVKFQKQNNLKATGVANQATWKLLIQKSIRNKESIPSKCKSSNLNVYNVCYDRSLHRAVLYKGKTLQNEWLVRGGGYAADMQTRVGDYSVFRRSKGVHISSIYGTKMYNTLTFNGGQALHGSPLMTNPFDGHSHGCINMYIEDSKQLFDSTINAATVHVHVYGSWS